MMKRLAPSLRLLVHWDIVAALLAGAGAEGARTGTRWLLTAVVLGLVLRGGGHSLAGTVAALALAAAMTLLGWALERVCAYLELVAKQRMAGGVTLGLLRWVNHAPLEALEDPRQHDLLARARDDVSGELLGAIRSATAMVSAAVGMAVLGLLVARIAPVLVAAVVAAAFALTAVETRFGLAQYFLNDELTEGERRAEHCHALFFDPAAAREMRVFACGGWLRQTWGQWVDAGFRRRTALLASHASVHALGALDVALTVAAVVVGVHRLQHGHATLGQVAFLIASMGPLGGHAFTLAYESSALTAARRLLRDAIQVIGGDADAPPETSVRTTTERIAGSPRPVSSPGQDGVQVPCSARGDAPPPHSNGPTLTVPGDNTPEPYVVDLRAVHFTYPGSAQPALRDVTLRITRGERVALVGENGSGKTTLAMLALGLYQPTAGTIACGAPHPGVVLQSFNRYGMSAAANVAIGGAGRGPVPRTRLLEAAEQAGLRPVVAELPRRWATLLEEGLDLSGGQWQRLALARALVGGTGLWVCDEPAAALDPLAEMRLVETLKAAVGSDALVVISHRLGIIRLVERVVVLERGGIVQDGRPADLAETDGPFREMYQAQARWYR